MSHRPFLIALALLVAARPVHAVTLSTPWVFVGGEQAGECNVTNVGTKPATVSIELYDAAGGRVGPEVDSCAGLPLAPKKTCGVGASRGDDFHCVVKSSSGAVRAAATVMLPGTASTAVVVVPATAK